MKQSLVTLCIDTASPYLSLALYNDGKLLGEMYQLGHNDHSKTCMPLVEKLCQDAAITPKTIEQILVGIGPGSYTGVRVGVVVAKMLAWTLGVDLFTVSSLAVLASSSNEERVSAMIDARRGNGFIGGFYYKDNVLYRDEEDRFTSEITFDKTYAIMINEGKPNYSVLFNSPLVEQVNNIHTLEPIYLRETEAERQLKDK